MKTSFKRRGAMAVSESGRGEGNPVEALERRQLLSVSLEGSVLRITGSGGADLITAREIEGRIIVEVNGNRRRTFSSGVVSGIFVNARTGNDEVTLAVDKACTVQGGNGDDTLSSGRGRDLVEGNDGNDSLRSGGGGDVVTGGFGDDTLVGNGGADNLNGGDGEDSVVGSGGDDEVFGGAGNDNVQGGKGDDTLRGDAGNDTLDGSSGSDDLNGGTGTDQMTGGPGKDVDRDGKDSLLDPDGNGASARAAFALDAGDVLETTAKECVFAK